MEQPDVGEGHGHPVDGDEVVDIDSIDYVAVVGRIMSSVTAAKRQAESTLAMLNDFEAKLGDVFKRMRKAREQLERKEAALERER